jgi:hypothetical protein
MSSVCYIRTRKDRTRDGYYLSSYIYSVLAVVATTWLGSRAATHEKKVDLAHLLLFQFRFGSSSFLNFNDNGSVHLFGF